MKYTCSHITIPSRYSPEHQQPNGWTFIYCARECSVYILRPSVRVKCHFNRFTVDSDCFTCISSVAVHSKTTHRRLGAATVAYICPALRMRAEIPTEFVSICALNGVRGCAQSLGHARCDAHAPSHLRTWLAHLVHPLGCVCGPLHSLYVCSGY